MMLCNFFLAILGQWFFCDSWSHDGACVRMKKLDILPLWPKFNIGFKIVLCSLHHLKTSFNIIVDRWVLPHLFFEILSTIPPNPNFHPTALFVTLFLWQMGNCTIFDLALYIFVLCGSTHVEPWYSNTRGTLLCILCNKA